MRVVGGEPLRDMVTSPVGEGTGVRLESKSAGKIIRFFFYFKVRNLPVLYELRV